jgi:hypothetical protein
MPALSRPAAPAAAKARHAPHRVLAPPEQREREDEGAAVAGDEHRAEADPAGSDPRLREVDEVVVREEAEQREQQVPVARVARVRRRHADPEDHHVGGGEDEAEPPRQLALVRRGRPSHQLGGRQRARREHPGRVADALAGLGAVSLEARERLLAGLRILLVALALGEDEAAAVGLRSRSPRTWPRSPTRRRRAKRR